MKRKSAIVFGILGGVGIAVGMLAWPIQQARRPNVPLSGSSVDVL